jgi:hypothetical protein
MIATLLTLAVVATVPAVLGLALYIATGGLADDIATLRRGR